jgi:hypothetical protein
MRAAVGCKTRINQGFDSQLKMLFTAASGPPFDRNDCEAVSIAKTECSAAGCGVPTWARYCNPRAVAELF